ncbi:periplasmic nitrate reductase subunit NapE [Dongia mobilis]|uniref:Periplasmic nitrate reductase subunit NapE n=1 Tax=Dongia mobilis TaxID=578943 RepID=A0A4R6WTR1_9PROT|nr:periplasmic nitrate reductase, NapE protein [Dongia mobilis]TDQ82280.1 periplasmic nitrate reductase subunit NapE [Dongia mobilis]
MQQTRSDSDTAMPSGRPRQRSEWLTFLFLTVILAPMIAVAVVGSYGFLIWIYQMIAGPPGPPAA